MVDYLEILRLYSLNYSQRAIAASVRCSRNTIRDVVAAAQRQCIVWPLSPDVGNKDLELLLFPERNNEKSIYVEPDYAYIHKELAKTGVTLTLLWEEYRRQCYEQGLVPYQSTQFGVKYRKWAQATKATLRIHHKPGEVMQIDWAGDTIPFFDSITGEEIPAYLFVASLPCSGMVYAEARLDMRTESWLKCHVHAFRYFGGVTRLLIPDNCKTATIANTRYETVLNKSYYELAEYYGTAIVPARVKKPKDKGHVEGSVKFAETWIIAALRDRKFFTIQEVQKAVSEKLEELNERPFKNRPGNRKEAFLEEEKAFLRPCPATDYVPSVWKVSKVGVDYLVSDGLNKYSVPSTLIGEIVDIRTTENTIEVFFHGSRVALHRRYNTRQHDPIVKPEHMTEEHRKYLNYNSDDFLEWANSVGPMTLKAVRYFLESGRAPEQGYKACASLTRLAQRYSDKRLENACKRLYEYCAVPSVRNISSILKNGQDKVSSDKPKPTSTSGNSYGITRGAAYFQKGGDEE